MNTSIIILIAIIINGIISNVIANSCSNRKITKSKVFWVSFLLSPIIGMFIALMAPERKQDEPQIELEYDIPNYTKEDKLVNFFSDNAIFIFIILIIIASIIKIFA